MIQVDELRTYHRRLRGWELSRWCHLTDSDDDVDALHAFADKLNLKRSWFQPGSRPHYDLTAGRRDEALRLGAVFVPARQQVIERQQRLNRDGRQLCEARLQSIPGARCRNAAIGCIDGEWLCGVHAKTK